MSKLNYEGSFVSNPINIANIQPVVVGDYPYLYPPYPSYTCGCYYCYDCASSYVYFFPCDKCHPTSTAYFEKIETEEEKTHKSEMKKYEKMFDKTNKKNKRNLQTH